MSKMEKIMTGKSGKKRRKKRGRKPSSSTSLTSAKAKKMLRHGSARGHALTKKQRGFLGAVAGKDED